MLGTLTLRCFKLHFTVQGSEFYLCHGGSPLSDDDLISPSSGLLVLTAHYRVCGGKGGRLP